MDFIHSDIYSYLVLPLLIFFARITDVTLDTLRIIFMAKGKKYLPPLLGFVEVIIWLLAITRIFENLDNWLCYLAYGAGFAAGNFVGIIVEEKIALGVELIRIITGRDPTNLIKSLREKGYGITYIDAHGSHGEVGVIYSVIRRSDLKDFVEYMKVFNPNAFYTIEDIRFVNKDVFRPVSNTVRRKRGLFR
ncbi:MAG: DUF2179 domain-containing protein [Bacteroidales bacterium]|nr:DUF2179 domain-containing protein [Bacteroidales bacterium]